MGIQSREKILRQGVTGTVNIDMILSSLQN